MVQLRASNGIFDRKTEQLPLTDDIVLTSTSGYEARLTQAVVDVKGGNVSSSNPVEVKMLNGTLTADRLEVADKGAMARFDGNVVMSLNLDSSTRAAPKAPQ